MGRRGPPPTPTALRVLRGNPQRRPLNDREPQPNANRPTKPRTLKGEALAEWERVVPELHRLGLLTKVDRAALVLYCTQWALHEEARADIEKFGAVLSRAETDQAGNRRIVREASPYVAIQDRAAQRIRNLCGEFGLTPSARSRMQLPGETPTRTKFEEKYG